MLLKQNNVFIRDLLKYEDVFTVGAQNLQLGYKILTFVVISDIIYLG